MWTVRQTDAAMLLGRFRRYVITPEFTTQTKRRRDLYILCEGATTESGKTFVAMVDASRQQTDVKW